MSDTTRDCPGPKEASLKVKVLYYPFMGTNVDTERLLLLAKLCYAPMGISELEALLGQAREDSMFYQKPTL